MLYLSVEKELATFVAPNSHNARKAAAKLQHNEVDTETRTTIKRLRYNAECNKNHRECDLNSWPLCNYSWRKVFEEHCGGGKKANPQTAIFWAMNVCVWLASWHKNQPTNSYSTLFDFHSESRTCVAYSVCILWIEIPTKTYERHQMTAVLSMKTWIQDISTDKKKITTETTELSSKHIRYFDISTTYSISDWFKFDLRARKNSFFFLEFVGSGKSK